MTYGNYDFCNKWSIRFFKSLITVSAIHPILRKLLEKLDGDDDEKEKRTSSSSSASFKDEIDSLQF